MNKNEKDFMNQLSNLDDFSVEEIAENYPALDENTKKRILKKCMKKDSLSAKINYDGEKKITVSGIEHYNRASWYKYASSAAAFILAFVGIASVVIINRNLNGNIEIEKKPAHPTNIYSATVNTSKTTVTTFYEPFSEYKTTNENTSVVSNNTDVQSATQSSFTPPAVTQSPDATQEPVTVTSSDETQEPVTVTSSDETEQITTAVQTEPQKSFLNGLYYVEISGVSGYCDENQITRGVHGYMGFEFMPDGTLTKYFFDETGEVINSTIVTTNYEIVENQFSFGDKAGTIVNPNDTENFSVQIDNSEVFNLSTKRPAFRKYGFLSTKPDTMNGTVWGKNLDIDENYNCTKRRTIEFKEDGISGTEYIVFYPNDATKRVITEIPFTYEQNGDEITFYMENSAYAMVKAEIKYSSSLETYGLNVEYQVADEWGNTLMSFGQTGCLNDYNYNY